MLISKFQVFADTSLYFALRVYGRMLPDEHTIYTKYNRSLFNITLTALINEILTFDICGGLTRPKDYIFLTVMSYQRNLII